MIILYLLVAAATGYFAGIYHNRGLMVLFVAELLLAAALLVLSTLFRAALRAGFVHRFEHTRSGAAYACRVRISKKWILPVSCFRFFYRMDPLRRPAGSGKNSGKRHFRRANEKWQAAYGGIDSPTLIMTFPVPADSPGFVRCRIRNLQVWDYLKLFRMTRKMEDEMLLTILPEEVPLHIRFESEEMTPEFADSAPYSSARGDDHSEIRQIREYRPEDSMRYIHWKQSARLDQIMVREYENEQDPAVTLYLEPGEIDRRPQEQQDSFYQLIYSAMLGLAETGMEISLVWRDRDAKLRSRIIRTSGDCGEIMPAFYQWTAELPENKQGSDYPWQNIPYDAPADPQEFSRDYFRIDADLCLWHMDQMVYRFPAGRAKILQEIRAF